MPVLFLLLQSVCLWFRVCFSENIITSLLLSIVLPLFQKSLSRECRSLQDLNSFYPLSLISSCLKLAYFTVLFNYFSFEEFRVFYLDFGVLVHTSLSRSSQIFTLNQSLGPTSKLCLLFYYYVYFMCSIRNCNNLEEECVSFFLLANRL